MIDERGQARITDFGLAAAAGTVETRDIRTSTPGYMPPEQWAGEEVTRAERHLHSGSRALTRREMLALATGTFGAPMLISMQAPPKQARLLVLAKVLEDSPDDARLGDEGHEPELASATVTKEGVDLKTRRMRLAPRRLSAALRAGLRTESAGSGETSSSARGPRL